LTRVEITGAVPRFSQREITSYTRRVLLALEKIDRIDHPISEVSIALVDDRAMKVLNRKFRGQNKTTDVLTFPADDTYADPGSDGIPLGDIIISVDQARRQATAEKHSLAVEVRYLILHGVLHALGYDHETDNGEMNALEVEIRASVGLS
jgi:probable rRNA maturation factor